MSNPRYGWWGYVKDIIHRYPALKEQHDDMLRQSVTPLYAGMPSGGAATRTTEVAAVRAMTKTNAREYYAVSEALNVTRVLPDGSERVKLVSLIYWKRTHSLSGATQECHVCERTGREWHRQFIRLVAKEYGLME